MGFLTLLVGSLVLPLLLSPLIVPAVTTAQVIPSEEETKIEKEAETTITITEDNGQATTYTWEEYTRQKAAKEAAQRDAEEAAQRDAEEERWNQEQQKKRDEFYQKYGSKYFLHPFSGKVYPKLNGKEPVSKWIDFCDEDPYSYSQDIYYKYDYDDYTLSGHHFSFGKVLQWIDENIVLYDFSAREASFYDQYLTPPRQGSHLGMVIIDRSIDANPFHRSDVYYQYIGVYDYTTVSGRYNVVPVFKIVYPLDIDY
ncbi:hypothetical protein [uncultured Treponema sp.]|uniref:cell envelope integrity protein TolA n=1 Tax=uncultured Treponema sp. TaxID=162155 RepID=UPI00280C1A61|nr:hypothetical protein [uncultured Treponema sp.]